MSPACMVFIIMRFAAFWLSLAETAKINAVDFLQNSRGNEGEKYKAA